MQSGYFPPEEKDRLSKMKKHRMQPMSNFIFCVYLLLKSGIAQEQNNAPAFGTRVQKSKLKNVKNSNRI